MSFVISILKPSKDVKYSGGLIPSSLIGSLRKDSRIDNLAIVLPPNLSTISIGILQRMDKIFNSSSTP